MNLHILVYCQLDAIAMDFPAILFRLCDQIIQAVQHLYDLLQDLPDHLPNCQQSVETLLCAWAALLIEFCLCFEFHCARVHGPQAEVNQALDPTEIAFFDA